MGNGGTFWGTIPSFLCFLIVFKMSAGFTLLPVSKDRMIFDSLITSNTGRIQQQHIGPLLAVSNPEDLLDKDDSNHNIASFQEQVGLFYNMATPFFKDEDNVGRNLLLGVIGLTLLNSGVSVAFSYIGRDFWTALSNKNPDEFYLMLQKFMAALVAGVPVTVFYKFQRDKLALVWREWMTKRIMEIYYANQTYYALEANREIDNPDQRIAEDVKAYTKYSLDLLITIMTSVIDLVSFSSILFSIYPQLFGAIIAYAGVGTLVTTRIGQNLIGLNFNQLQKEADFRYSLMRVRENAESIAFYGGEPLELKEIGRRLNEVVKNYQGVINSQRNLEFFTVSYRYLIQVIPGLVIAPLYFSSKIQLGVVSQSYGAFNHILSDLSIIVNQFERLSAFSAGIDRLGQFLKRMSQDGDMQKLLSTGARNDTVAQELAASKALELLSELDALENELNGVSVQIVPGASLSTKDLTVMTPDEKRTLVTGLSFELSQGQKLLIVGESGTGKSSLLRTLAGLWTAGSGSIVRPPSEEMFFLPQRPYCTLGPLRDQLTYPKLPGEVDDSELLEILKQVDLAELPTRMGDGDPIRGLYETKDWSDILSLGEQQRLAFGRLLYNRPSVAIMDEATSALDLTNEKRMYGLLKEHLPNLSYVSVGHRPSLLVHHDTKLRLSNDGYTLEPIDQTVFTEAGVSDLINTISS